MLADLRGPHIVFCNGKCRSTIGFRTEIVFHSKTNGCVHAQVAAGHAFPPHTQWLASICCTETNASRRVDCILHSKTDGCVHALKALFARAANPPHPLPPLALPSPSAAAVAAAVAATTAAPSFAPSPTATLPGISDNDTGSILSIFRPP